MPTYTDEEYTKYQEKVKSFLSKLINTTDEKAIEKIKNQIANDSVITSFTKKFVIKYNTDKEVRENGEILAAPYMQYLSDFEKKLKDSGQENPKNTDEFKNKYGIIAPLMYAVREPILHFEENGTYPNRELVATSGANITFYTDEGAGRDENPLAGINVYLLHRHNPRSNVNQGVGALGGLADRSGVNNEKATNFNTAENKQELINQFLKKTIEIKCLEDPKGLIESFKNNELNEKYKDFLKDESGQTTLNKDYLADDIIKNILNNPSATKEFLDRSYDDLDIKITDGQLNFTPITDIEKIAAKNCLRELREEVGEKGDDAKGALEELLKSSVEDKFGISKDHTTMDLFNKDSTMFGGGNTWDDAFYLSNYDKWKLDPDGMYAVSPYCKALKVDKNSMNDLVTSIQGSTAKDFETGSLKKYTLEEALTMYGTIDGRPSSTNQKYLNDFQTFCYSHEAMAQWSLAINILKQKYPEPKAFETQLYKLVENTQTSMIAKAGEDGKFLQINFADIAKQKFPYLEGKEQIKALADQLHISEEQIKGIDARADKTYKDLNQVHKLMTDYRNLVSSSNTDQVNEAEQYKINAFGLIKNILDNNPTLKSSLLNKEMSPSEQTDYLRYEKEQRKIDNAKTVFVVVDYQNTFANELPVEGAKDQEVIDNMNKLSTLDFGLKIATIDDHTKGSKTFASNHKRSVTEFNQDMQTRYLLEKKNIFYDEDRKKYFLKTNENGKVTIAETEDPTNKDKDNKNIFTLPEPEYKEWLQDIRSKQYTYNKEEKTYLPNAYVAQEVLENGYIKATLNNKEVWVKDKILSTVWPDHGLQGTNQVQLLGDQEFKDIVKSQFDGIVIKGLDPRYEEYSAGGFGTQKFIDSKFIDRKIEEPKRIFIAGLATNICVFNTAKELHAKYPKSEICIVDDASKGVYSEKDGLRKKDYESQYRDAGIKIVTTKEALRITNGEDNTKTTSTKKKTSLEIITSYGEQNSILDVKTSNNTYGSRYHQARHIAQDIFGQEVTTRQIKAFTPNILAAQKAKLRGVSK